MCKKCGKPVLVTEIFRTTTCPDCGADLHSCVNCKFYSVNSHFDCRETIQEPVVDKERANFCDFYSLNPVPFKTDDRQARAKAQAKAQAQALFGAPLESGSASDKDAAKNAFNSLFGN